MVTNPRSLVVGIMVLTTMAVMQGAMAVVLRATAMVPRTTAVVLGASWVTLLVMSITRVHFKSA